MNPIRNISRPDRVLVLCAAYLCGFSLYLTKPSVCSNKPNNNQINGVKHGHRQNSDTEQEYPENPGCERLPRRDYREADGGRREHPIDSSIEDRLAQAKSSRSQAEKARQKIDDEILEAAKEVCQNLIADGEQTLKRAKNN